MSNDIPGPTIQAMQQMETRLQNAIANVGSNVGKLVSAGESKKFTFNLPSYFIGMGLGSAITIATLVLVARFS